MRRSFEFYFDFISPFGYLASLRVDDLATGHQRECRWQAMLLGISVLKVMGMQPLTQIPLKGDYLRIDLERYLRRHKLTLARTRDTGPSNPIPAGRTFHWIDQYDQTLAKKVAKAILDAYWRQGEDIGSPETVMGCNEASPAAKPTACCALLSTARWRWGCSDRLSSSSTANRSSAWRRWNSWKSGSAPAAGDP
jgi:2-hydroxychromene-2-carboxylate isomerase